MINENTEVVTDEEYKGEPVEREVSDRRSPSLGGGQ